MVYKGKHSTKMNQHSTLKPVQVFRFPQQYGWGTNYFGMQQCVTGWLVFHISRQYNSCTFKSQNVHEQSLFRHISN